ncbi:MAG TPA: hypothetical protein GX398_04910 [Candidatus Cloacimonetes bacterium]|nr:hypothetical protein [Candidatus Cloacimonas sp.]HHZ15432.1 hypothetical protein [Candidatus Cloacimonadota bacterium]
MKHLSALLFLGIMLMLIIPLQAQTDLAFQPTIRHRRGALGVGYGLCYAGLGFNGDYNFNDDIAVSGSIGSFSYVGGYELGVKYYFLAFDKHFRPKLSVWYGVNGIVHATPPETTGLPRITEAHQGFTVGVGGELMFGSRRRHGVDFDILYIVYTTQTKRLEELESQGYPEFVRSTPILFSLGYRYAF